VVVSHRTSLLRLTDKILLLRDGQAAAFGPRDKVLQGMNPPGAQPAQAPQAAPVAATAAATPAARPAAAAGAAPSFAVVATAQGPSVVQAVPGAQAARQGNAV
jgi:ATP-binding cassette subfamily C exporter for protease/lipase